MNTDFLFWEYLEDLSLCDRLIQFHKNSNEKEPGCTGAGVNTETKDSTDVVLKNDALAQEYLFNLQKVTNKYVEKFPFCNGYSSWDVIENIQIQHYEPPKQAYKSWHTERYTSYLPSSTRHLVFMTYLNDVHDGGETEWYHQNIKLSPRKGLTAIWPVDWTYTHRGVPSKTEHKYIITGWYSYYV